MGSTSDDYYTNGDGFRSFEVAGLASEDGSTPTGIREDLLLLSWLTVLLRTREDGQASFDWAYAGGANGDVDLVRHLSTEEVMIGLQSKVGDAIAATSRQIKAQPSSPCRADVSALSSLLLSTGSLSQTSQGAKDEVSRQLLILPLGVANDLK